MDPRDPGDAAARAAAQRESLPPGTRLADLELVRTLGIGGFGTVYLARDRQLERDVAVKEYLPPALAYRADGLRVEVRGPHLAAAYAAGLRSFVNEARILARLNHPAVVKVHRFWEANGTAYMVMPWVQGPTLREVRRAMTGPPSEAWLRAVIDPLLDALELLHDQGIYHRDIAPDNILLPSPHEPVLLDFGAARRVIADGSETVTAVLKPSFAPIEQYAESSQLRQGPWTDLYALGAVVVYLLTAVAPPPSTVRSVQDELALPDPGPPPAVSAHFLAALRWALAVRPQDRPQSVREFRDVLEGVVGPPVDDAAVLADAAYEGLSECDAAMAMVGSVGEPAWDPTVRMSARAPRPALRLPFLHATRRGPSRAVFAASLAVATLAGGVALAWLQRGPPEPEPATWRALGRQAARVEKPIIDETVEEVLPASPPRPVTLAPALPPAPPRPVTLAPALPPAPPRPVTLAVPPPAQPVLRAVSATPAPGVEEPRMRERRGLLLGRMGSSGTSHLDKGSDRRGANAAARKGGTARDRLAGSDPAGRMTPREACGERSFLGMAICINQQCESPRFMQHPHCVALRRQWQEGRMRAGGP